MQEVFVNTVTALHSFEFFNQFIVPARVYCPEIFIINKQGNGIKPMKKLTPLFGMVFKLVERFTNQTIVARIMFPQVCSSTARAGPGAVSQSIIFVIPHNNTSGTQLNHIPDKMQCLTNSWAAVDNISDKDGLPPVVLVNTVDLAIAHLLQKPDQRVGTTMNISNNVIAATRSFTSFCHS